MLQRCHFMEYSVDINRFIGIPIFISRAFRHSTIYINKNSGIKVPEDLLGKIIGLPEYTATAMVWIRGILQNEYGS